MFMPQTIRYNKILHYAHQEAERLQNKEVLPEHLLLGILRVGEGGAYTVLSEQGVVAETAKETLDDVLTSEPEEEESDMLEPICRSASVDRICRIAETIARERQLTAVTSSCLLMAILRERVNTAAEYLETDWGITYDKVAVPHAGPSIDDDVQEPEESSKSSSSSKSSKFKEEQGKTDTPFLDKYSRDLTKQAKEGKLDPVVGREAEIQRVMQILSRRRKNNPILIGEPGVGKSAIVEGLAQSNVMEGKRIISLDISSIVAGTTYRGQFEERMKNVLSELRQHPEIILFIDEIHTIIGAGNASGSLDAANILKPALSRGEMQCIGATTTSEYAKTIEKDGALERRFQKVQVRPNTAEETLEILRILSIKYAQYHHVAYPEETLRACVTLAERYLTDRAFPDKAIDVMDEVGAQKGGSKVQGCEVAVITPDDVARVVSLMSGVPVQRLRSDEHERLRTMAERLQRKVIGQNEAIRTVVSAIQRSRLGLRDPKRPIGTFFFLGPTGVGKTYLAQCLAEEMFGSKDALIRFDMSEYTEKHTASLLVGAPPGYVAYEEGGKLTEAVRRKPYSIVLFDEIEKAHPDIFNVMLQILDEGRLTDRQGRQVDFRNTIIILTSNVGTRQLKDFGAGVGFDQMSMDEATRRKTLLKALDKTFPPEFVNRIDNVITFAELTEDDLMHVLDTEIDQLSTRLKKQGYSLSVSENVRRELVRKGDKQYGARPLRRAVQTCLEDRITERMLAPNHRQEASGRTMHRIQINKI